jgi:hypothetical protein
MISVFLMHLIATIVNAIFIILLWWYNQKLVTFNYQLMKDNRDILVEAKRIQDRLNDLEAGMPGTIWLDTETHKVYVRAVDEDNKCFYCKCDIDKSIDFPFIHKDTFKHEWRCAKCNDENNK